MAARLIHMKCQSCGANLDLDLDHLMAFCPYCGEKLFIDIEKLNEVLIAKEVTKRDELKYDYELEKKRIETVEKKNNDKVVLFILFGMIISLIVILIIWR